MREARIILPHYATAASVDAHQKLRHALLAAFGGYTVTNGTGAWLDGEKPSHDNVTIYDVAVHLSKANREHVREIAVSAATALGEKAVYVRYPEGNVDIIPLARPKEDEAVDIDDVDLENGPVLVSGGVRFDEEERTYYAVNGGRTLHPGFSTYEEAREWLKRFQQAPLPGQRRLPNVGEVWEATDGTRVAVLQQASILNGGYNVVTLTVGTHAMRVGFPYVVDLDGKFGRRNAGDVSGHPLDLRRFVMRFVD